MSASTNGAAIDPLIARAPSTAEHINQADDLITYLSLVQQINFSAPTQAAGYPATALLEHYATNGFLVEVGPEWSLNTTRNAIDKGTHYSTLSP